MPAYGVACGSSPVGSVAIVSVTGKPGRTTPLAGVTVSQAAPAAAAANGMGPPVVESCSVCVAG